MKTFKLLFAALTLFSYTPVFSQSVEIGSGAEIVSGAGTDICASNWGNISGNITGSGTQCSGVLPVVLISFTASVQNERDIKLSWITAIEINNSGFEVERKYSEHSWTKIGSIIGSGNSAIQREYVFTDSKLKTGIYTYRLKQIDYNGNSEYFLLNSDVEIKPPGEFNLSQNYPNPSNPVSKIDYQIPFSAKVLIRLYDVSGREVTELVNKTQEAGYYDVKFDGSNLASGVYFYSISAIGESAQLSATKKMLLVK